MHRQSAGASSKSGLERFEVPGGPAVIVVPVEGTSRVAVQAIYDVGIVDEPRGIPQASHLIEHLACVGAAAKSRTGEAFAVLNLIGMANAETLPSLTHFDYALPADRLELALETEAERLRSLVIDSKTIAEEAAKCYREVRFVASRTPPALGKFALMAANQAWRYSMERADVLKGLESASPEQLRAFHRRFYRRANLTLVVAGNASRPRVEELVKKHFAEQPSPKTAQTAIDWSKMHNRIEVRWDTPATIVYLAFPPPQEPAERLLATAVIQTASMRLQGDPEVREFDSGDDSSGMVWPVGRAPAFAAFTLKTGVNHADTIPRLAARFQTALEEQSASDLVQVTPMFAELPWTLNEQTLKTNAEQLKRQMGSLERAHDAVLGNFAIQTGLREVWLGPERGGLLGRARSVLRDDWKGFIKRNFAAERRNVAVLLPWGT